MVTFGLKYDNNPWRTTDLELELEKSAGSQGNRNPELTAWAERVTETAGAVFCAERGELVWDRPTLKGMWKRHNNCFRDKVNVDLAAFLRPHPEAESDAALAMALRNFILIRGAGRDNASPLASIADVT